ncbi:MAG: serine hydrolase [Candidatus Zixiibacteriota bacterium]|nr:MAG: serine hydrolase [candidate division Zixibacteria bacterium]
MRTLLRAFNRAFVGKGSRWTMKSIPTLPLVSGKEWSRHGFLTALVLGTAIFIASCSDNGDDSSVSSDSQPPVVEGIPDQSVNEGEVFATIALDQYVSDADNTDSEITWTFSGADSLRVTIDYPRIATVRLPSMEWNGSETITFTANDSAGNSSSDTAVFTVNGVNDVPYVLDIPPQVIYESLTFDAITLDDYIFDHDNTAAEMTWTYSGNVDLAVVIDSYRFARIAVPDPGWTGSETITFRATDPAGLSSERAVTFIVKPVVHDPLVLDDWPVSTPAEQGLDTELVHNTYLEAAGIDHIYSLLIVKNGYLVAECYFNGASASFASTMASATKSWTSALTGLALREGHLTSLDQKMVDFFPELNWASTDSRKGDITIRQMLQMRAGYPNEDEYYWDLLLENFYQDLSLMLVEFPLSFDPGTDRAYSNLTSHMIGVIVARASDTDLKSLLQTHLLDPLECGPVSWPVDGQGYCVGWGGLCVRPRDMAKFGLVFLNNGVYKGTQVIPADWVTESLTAYTTSITEWRYTDHLTDINYGYQWWGGRAGTHDVHFAAGACGQLIVIVPDMDMVLVTSAEKTPLFDPESGHRFVSIVDMVAKFISLQ